MKWGHLPERAAGWGKLSDGMASVEDTRRWWWWRQKMCGEAGVSALRFHLRNLPSIVQDYYQLFNNSYDIYQGQLYPAVSCRENGLQSVLLLHSQAGNERLFTTGGRNLWLELPLFSGSVPTFSHKGYFRMLNAQFQLFSSNSFDPDLYCTGQYEHTKQPSLE